NSGVCSDTIGSLSGAGNVVLGGNPLGYGNTLGSLLTTGGSGISTTFSGSITGVGGRFTKNGAGTMTLTGTNTFTGRTFINVGTLRVEGGSALSDSTWVIMSSGATLDLGANETVGTLSSSNSTSSVATVALGALNLTLNADNQVVAQFNGKITGTGKLIKTGPGIFEMATATNASTYSGGTDVLAGTVVVAGGGKLGTGTLTLDGGGTIANFNTVGISITTPVTIGGGGGGVLVARDTSAADRNLTFTGV